MDDRLPAKLAHKASRSTGLELDDLLQEARLAYWKAKHHGSYDPHKSAWSTYSYISVSRHLWGVTDSHRRKYPDCEELSDEVPCGDPSPEDRAIFMEMLRQLPDDARTVVDLVFSGAPELSSATPARIRQVLRSALGWPADRVNEAVRHVTAILREPMVRRAPVAHHS